MATDPFNNVDKAMYPDNMGRLPGPEDQDLDIESEEDDGPEYDDEEDDFEIQDDEDGGVTITFGPDSGEMNPKDAPFGANLAEYIDEKDLGLISTELVSFIEDDDSSRQEWKDTYEKGLTLLGLQYEERTEPFDGASGVVHPILN